MENEKAMTILELLLNHLPPRYVQALVRNIDDPTVLADEAQSIEEEMLTLFDWEESNEGYDFWSDVLEHIITGTTELPKLRAEILWKPTTYIVTAKGNFIMNIAGVGYNIFLGKDTTLPDIEDNQVAKEIYYQWAN
jgi:hypothetical protein